MDYRSSRRSCSGDRNPLIGKPQARAFVFPMDREASHGSNDSKSISSRIEENVQATQIEESHNRTCYRLISGCNHKADFCPSTSISHSGQEGVNMSEPSGLCNELSVLLNAEISFSFSIDWNGRLTFQLFQTEGFTEKGQDCRTAFWIQSLDS